MRKRLLSAEPQAGHAFSVSVNVSAQTLQNLEYPQHLLGLLREQALEANHLIVEVTETDLFSDLASSLEVLSRLTMNSIELSIDDFGTGYSSLQQLKRFPVDLIKSDRTFIRDVLTNGRDSVLLGAIIGLAHAMGYEVVAKGVQDLRRPASAAAIPCGRRRTAA